MNLRHFLPAIMTAACALPASASDFISIETPDRLFNFGVRLGVNTSNRTFGKGHFNEWNVNGWGTGIDAGVVVNLNMREFFSIQPGFFFESRSGNYSYVDSYRNSENENSQYTQLGHVKTYNFLVPVMLSFRFNLTDNLKWLLEAGPYAQFKLHSSDDDKIAVLEKETSTLPTRLTDAKSSFTDFGVKMGSGLMIKDHWSFSIHYLAGCTNVWKSPFEGGRNKAWTFTLGYDF